MSKQMSLRIAAAALLWISFFFPWIGTVSLATVFFRSLSFMSVITVSLLPLLLVILSGLLFAFPLANVVTLFRPARSDVPWLLSLAGYILLPFGLMASTGVITLAPLSWGYGLYGAGLLAACLAESASRTRRQAAVPGILLITFLLAGTFTGAEGNTRPETFALVNGMLIDGTGRPPVSEAVVLVRGRQIAAAGPKTSVTIPPGVRQIDVNGGFILPGIIDAHVHNAYRSDHLAQWARSGVTTVCDVGAPVTEFFSLRRDQLALDPNLARLVTAGPIMTVPDGYPIAVNHFPSLAVTSPGDASWKTTFLAGQGAQVIKTALDSTGLPSLNKEELTAIVQAAHRSGLRVRVHQTALGSLKLAVDSGVDIVDHVEAFVPDEVIQTMAQKGVTWVPTLKVIQNFMSRDGSGTVRDYIRSGGRVALGTDSGYYTFLKIGMPMYEIKFLSRAGLDPMQVIVAATQNSAYACGIERETGTLEPEKAADILVLSDDPLQDLEAFAQPQIVIHKGKVIAGDTHSTPSEPTGAP